MVKVLQDKLASGTLGHPESTSIVPELIGVISKNINYLIGHKVSLAK
jgi:hypothetical protein